MSYCSECGTRLVDKFLENEGMIPWCETCRAFRFPVFSTAVSMVVYSPDMQKILLIKQYGRDRNILVAGYLNKGESAEHALAREVMEEVGLRVTQLCFNRTEYFAPSNTLMINFACRVESDDLSHMTDEVDKAAWYTPDGARAAIAHGSLAERFLLHWLKKRESGAAVFENLHSPEQGNAD